MLSMTILLIYTKAMVNKSGKDDAKSSSNVPFQHRLISLTDDVFWMHLLPFGVQNDQQTTQTMEKMMMVGKYRNKN